MFYTLPKLGVRLTVDRVDEIVCAASAPPRSVGDSGLSDAQATLRSGWLSAHYGMVCTQP